VHSHVVPSGDDGVRSAEEGVALCEEAARRGTSVLFATPHVWPHLPLNSERDEKLRAAHAEMAWTLAAVGLDLRLGFEVTPAPALLDDDLSRYRLGEVPAVLMELPFAGPLGLPNRIAEEIEAVGLTPILAHPERAEAVVDEPKLGAGYAERGWLLQVNATSLLGYHGEGPEETGWLLVERGLADLVASDGHRSARPPFLDDAYEAVRRRIGERAESLFDGSALRRLRDRRPPRESSATLGVRAEGRGDGEPRWRGR
jgi:protein-tyrosine phosphatase